MLYCAPNMNYYFSSIYINDITQLAVNYHQDIYLSDKLCGSFKL